VDSIEEVWVAFVLSWPFAGFKNPATAARVSGNITLEEIIFIRIEFLIR
jgi:hypothetical protein